MCLIVSQTSGRGSLSPGARANYSITIWFAPGPGAPGTGGTGTGANTATVALSATPTGLAPRITACHLHGQQACQRISANSYSVTGMSVDQTAGLRARIVLPPGSAGEHVTVRVTAASPQSQAPALATASFVIHTPSPSPSPVPVPSGVGATLPPLPAGFYAPRPGAMPTLPSALTNPASAFPTLSPSDATPVSLPPTHRTRLTNASATVPLDMRLIGGQVAGLALLAAAVTIAVARLSLREPAPQRDKEPPDAT